MKVHPCTVRPFSEIVLLSRVILELLLSRFDAWLQRLFGWRLGVVVGCVHFASRQILCRLVLVLLPSWNIVLSYAIDWEIILRARDESENTRRFLLIKVACIKREWAIFIQDPAHLESHI